MPAGTRNPFSHTAPATGQTGITSSEYFASSASGDTTVVIGQLDVGDRVVLRPGDLIPADGRLLSETTRIDYSFVTGEAEPVGQVRGDLLYAGGRQALRPPQLC